MLEVLKKLEKQYQGTLNSMEDTWDLSFDIRNLPRETHILQFEIRNTQMHIKLECLWSIANKEGYWTDYLSNQIRVSIDCLILNATNPKDFRIMSAGLLKRLINKTNYKIIGDVFEQLNTNQHLNRLYTEARQFGDLDPAIIGKELEEKQAIKVIFQGKKIPESILSAGIEFCAEFDASFS